MKKKETRRPIVKMAETFQVGGEKYTTYRNVDGMFIFVPASAGEMKNVRVVK